MKPIQRARLQLTRDGAPRACSRCGRAIGPKTPLSLYGGVLRCERAAGKRGSPCGGVVL